ncbi:putative manganese transporter [Alteromonas sp. 1_MG-2023]|uniref:putative manganese transporter n=1 Tax=Alteromonas sp. 1_MG-2023 TaxID=3062669 RepID=UPI0026E22286|nr:putative manganese transporter [Alteromonas sp. 1_MG-2023]MDO6567262.1 putative manganese transporter [Alteromonas sp. 1_MG-2023]
MQFIPDLIVHCFVAINERVIYVPMPFKQLIPFAWHKPVNQHFLNALMLNTAIFIEKGGLAAYFYHLEPEVISLISSEKAHKVGTKQKSLMLNKRLFLPALILALLAYSFTREATLAVLSDAYFQVAAFVYTSLSVYYIATLKVSAEAIGDFMRKHPLYEVGLASFLGALPGCGGAIIVVTQYTRGVTSFGAVVAVLTSTMGDAAFLLLAQAPLDGLTVMGVGMVVGTITGVIVNRFHNYQPPAAKTADLDKNTTESKQGPHPISTLIDTVSTYFWLVVALPSLAIALGLSFQAPVHEYLGVSETGLQVIGAVLCLSAVTLWSLNGGSTGYASLTKEDAVKPPPRWQSKAALDTQFVLAWVVVAFLLFELSILWFGLDIGATLTAMGPSVVGLAILVGFLPGCGPQILVTSLYLNGAVPFSAQLGNAISNDGDALFPAIALSPKAAILATVYSAIPAIAVGYGYYFLFEV